MVYILTILVLLAGSVNLFAAAQAGIYRKTASLCAHAPMQGWRY